MSRERLRPRFSRTASLGVALSLLVGGFSACAPLDDNELAAQAQAIVNGTATTIAQHPFQVRLVNSHGEHFCGGSVLAANWILSAQHCLQTSTPGLERTA